MIHLNGSPREIRTWHALLDLAEAGEPWAVIGARMVELHAVEHGRTLSRVSFDGDALADARVRPNPVRRLAHALINDGFDLSGASVMGTGHTFIRADVEIDLLAPDHLGEHSERERTTIPPLHTIEVPGGRQALDRVEWVDVEVAGRQGRLPRPNLLGAILLKARAVDVSDAPENMRRDLALLLSIVTEPEALGENLRGGERAWLRRRSEMNGENAACWIGISPDDRQNGLSALRILAHL